MTFEQLLRAYDDAEAHAAAIAAVVEAARKALARAEAQAADAVAAARTKLGEAEAAVVQAAEAQAAAREAIHVRLKEKGHHFLRGKDGKITVYRSLPDHDFEAFTPTPGD